MLSCLLYVGTEDGMFVFQAGGHELELLGRGVAGNAVRGITVHPEDPRISFVACGLRGWGLYKTANAGQSFELVGFTDRWVWDVSFHPSDAKTLWVGTEPPMLYVSSDGGGTFQACEGVEALPSRKRWKFFHPPFYAGHIHGMAIHPERPERIFAGVEHGALIFSADGGKTWQETLVGHDLHRLAFDPENPDRLLAGTGEGLFVSEDAGSSWRAERMLKGKYVHGVYFHPNDPRRVYVYVAEKGTPIYASSDGGCSFVPMKTALPENGPADCLCFHPGSAEVLFYGGEPQAHRGQLFVSPDGGESWQPLGPELPKIWRLRSAPMSAPLQAPQRELEG